MSTCNNVVSAKQHVRRAFTSGKCFCCQRSLATLLQYSSYYACWCQWGLANFMTKTSLRVLEAAKMKAVSTKNETMMFKRFKKTLKITHRTFIEHHIHHTHCFYRLQRSWIFPTWMKSSFQNNQFSFHVAVAILYENLGDNNPWISKRQFEYFTSNFWAVLIT